MSFLRRLLLEFFGVLESLYMDNFGAQHEIKDISRTVPLESISCNLNSDHYKHAYKYSYISPAKTT